MAHYGDPEAHRCILDEASGRPNAARLTAYLRAAVMGSQGSDVGLQQLRRISGALEQPPPHLKVTLALLSMTILASSARPAFRKERSRVQELLARERAALAQQADQLKAAACSDAHISGSSNSGGSGSPNVAVTFSSADLNSASAAVAGGVSSVLTADEPKEEALSPLQRWEQAMDILNYCEAYANYLSGFTVLWYELFGPHYYYNTPGDGSASDGGVNGCGGAEPESGERASPSGPSSPAPPFLQSSSPLSSSALVPRGPQVPPHLYAVRWADILTPQRRTWFQGLHSVVKELLVRIMRRELPIELYALYIQYANLSLRAYLLQTLAEVFEWTSHYLDILYYVHVMRQSYSIQCEMSQLQRIWAAFGLFDARFIDHCREFNKTYTESQGAFSEQRAVVTAANPAGGAAASAAGAAVSAHGGSGLLPPAVGLPPVESGGTLLSSTDVASMQHSSSGTGGTDEVVLLTPASYLAVGGGEDGGQGTRPAGVEPADTAVEHRMFPSRGAGGNTSSDAADAAHSSESSSPDDEALSTASEAAGDVEHDSATRKTKRAVYLPLFYTCCCFTWILQRTFWSMYGRCSLLFESCLGIEVTPQILRAGVDGGGVGGLSAPTLFTATSLGARRRGMAAESMTGRGANNAAAAALTGGSQNSKAGQSPPPASTRTGHAQAATRSHSGISNGAAAASQGAAGAAARHNEERSRSGEGQGSGTGKPPPAPRSPQPQPLPRPAKAERLSPQDGSNKPPHEQQRRSSAASPPAAHAEPQNGQPRVSLLATAQAAAAPPSSSPTTTRVLAEETRQSRAGEPLSRLAGWGALLSGLVPRRRRRSSPPVDEAGDHSPYDTPAAQPTPAAPTGSTAALSAPHTAPMQAADVHDGANGGSYAGCTSSAVDGAGDATRSLSAIPSTPPPLTTCSGAPFQLQYATRAREIQLYEDPSVNFTGGSNSSSELHPDSLFFEEFHFLRETGCYVLSHALRSLTCYPRYPVTLLIITDNTRRPGRVSWYDHKLTVLSSAVDDGEERRGLTPWVLNAVIPHTRLSTDGVVRAQQEERLLQHVVFQAAGVKRSRICFCTSNSVFYVLNSGIEMDGGRFYYALHLHVPGTASDGGGVSPEQVMQEESQWAFRGLGELHCSWAMPCTCNEALRVAFQVGPTDE